MKPIPFHRLEKVAWFVFISLAATALVAWWQFSIDRLEVSFAIAFSGLAILGSPLFPNAGWGVMKGGNLCRNRPTYLVAVGVYVLFFLAFWQYVVFDAKFDSIMALGEAVSGLIVVRAYSDAKKLQNQD